ncbi:hypothetical protein BDV10DRAFT_99018 [Aspergillus recurvatus]
MTSPNSQTEELNDEYLRVISIQGREYQQYSIDNKISFEPVDEVRSFALHETWLVSDLSRMKLNGWTISTGFSAEYLTTDSYSLPFHGCGGCWTVVTAPGPGPLMWQNDTLTAR